MVACQHDERKGTMQNKAESKTPIASFATPPHAPPAAAQAIADFERVADAWGAVKGEIADAQEAKAQALAEAKAAAVEATKSGTTTKINVVALAEKYDKQIAELEAREAVLRVAVDETGNDLALAVAENRGEWLARLEEAATDAEARYVNAIKEGLVALAELAPARGAVEWLAEFQSNRARHGLERQFVGGRIRVDHRFPGTIQSEWDPKELLAAAQLVAAPSPKPELARSRGSK
jgi:hypothetical protein